ncbi:protein POLLEN DEFECTIVE IN GUIDANCE 1 isoform X1 [Gossypium hirsutum]|uniref:Protein POLLEN DEFECTIVE IN GUIDANCE 1-like isoform X1 n=1 Tax=Gossypium hirsutum TaxID=3635 RepID=A0A1U8KLN9_GOSHI|nr:protein POLLEN DEFECTIVE IN GUIDANCE 1 isoform X1 [Gossypium hirsutum]XP_016703404.1 protein POLLEN DEFECTIVE IN GUIDANCE 1 isoform X1 [Gossypium hirsutum]XP_016703405.1 protein POLLEN DEFECTIVE IN GUIDANCE 1 isoform X1 [Gossypium hirsutum]XP_016703407.1 protein POLLEN DEFECTIVE IN GUIDANCE 1 isoform X1 [Gossypium hirsutum]
MKCIVEIHCGGPQHLVVRKNESECMILSSACHGDVKCAAILFQLIDVGFFVCFDAFLSLLTIIPTRILIKLWRFLTARQFKRLSAAKMCDFGCFLVLACGVILLGQTGGCQGTIKLYMIYNVLECFLLQLISSGQTEKSTSFSSSMMRIFQRGLLRQRD